MKAVERVKKLAKEVGLPSFNSLGVKESDLERLADMAAGNISTDSNPREMSKEDYLCYLKKRWRIEAHGELLLMKSLREDALRIIEDSISSVLPERAVEQELRKLDLGDKIYLVAIGKAAWRMAKSAKDCLKDKVKGGVVITKYGHSKVQ